MTKKHHKKSKRETPSADESRKRAEELLQRKDEIIAGIKEKDSLAEVLDELYGPKEPQDMGEGNGRATRMKLTPEESLERMKEFSIRKEKIIAALRKSKDRSISP